MATLSLKDINKIYPNNVQAVFDFNIEIKDKEFVVFVGPSGCGKSTTLRMIAGLEEISSGELVIDNEVMNHVSPKDRDIAMVFQSYALYPHMTVYGNMKFALKLRKVEKPIYLPYQIDENLLKENKSLRKQISKINSKFKKKQDLTDLLVSRQELYEKLYENVEAIDALKVQAKGIDSNQIKAIKKAEKRINGALARNEKKLEQLQNKPLKEEELSERAKKKHKITSKHKIENLIKVYSSAVEQNKRQLKEIAQDIEYLSNNEIPLCKMRHLTNLEMDIEINKVASKIDLVRYLYRKPAALSGGQRQRVALGRAIVRKPKVFLMDEPLSNLDAKLRVQTRGEILKIHKGVGATTIYVTHDQTEAMTMADRIVVMKDGYVQQIGTPDEVYNDPNNKFVAGFIGSPAMNFIKGTYKKGSFVANLEDNDSHIVGLDKFAYKVPEKYAKLLKGYEGKSLILGIRPEDIIVGKFKSADADISCTCDYGELLGYEYVLYTYICGQRLVVKTSVKNKAKTGDQFNAKFNDNIFFFDGETENRIK